MKDFPLIRTPKGAVAGMAALTLPILLLSLTPLTGLYALMLVLLMLPAGMCLVAATGGLAPACMGLAAGAVACWRLCGQPGLVAGLVYLGCVFGAFLFVMLRKPAFFKGCGVMILAHIFSLAGVYLYLQSLFQNQLYQAAGQAAAQFLSSLPEGDSLLVQLCSMGFIGLPDALKEQPLVMENGLYALTPAVREDLLLSVSAMVESMVRSLMPMLLAEHSIISGVACMALSQRFGKIYHDRLSAAAGPAPAPFRDLGMPPLSLWHLPRGLGWKVGLCWAAGMLMQGGTGDTLSLAGAILFHAANGVLSWQGAALMNFTQKAKGTRRFMRVLVPLLFFVMGILPFLGIFDQIINLRGLRKPPEPKEDQ